MRARSNVATGLAHVGANISFLLLSPGLLLNTGTDLRKQQGHSSTFHQVFIYCENVRQIVATYRGALIDVAFSICIVVLV